MQLKNEIDLKQENTTCYRNKVWKFGTNDDVFYCRITTRLQTQQLMLIEVAVSTHLYTFDSALISSGRNSKLSKNAQESSVIYKGYVYYLPPPLVF